jgi:hypothetical protein
MPKVEEAVRNLLLALGEDLKEEGFVESPRRIAKYWAEVLEGEDYTNAEIAEMYNKAFPPESHQRSKEKRPDRPRRLFNCNHVTIWKKKNTWVILLII